jgi:hypothetical protein
MAWNSDKSISMEIEPDFDYIIEEGQNTSINLRRINWNGRGSKLDLRKWVYNGGSERAMKGISLSEEGADILTNTLVKLGYGSTRDIINNIKNRDDFNQSLLNPGVQSQYVDDGTEEYYDPSELLGDVNG